MYFEYCIKAFEIIMILIISEAHLLTIYSAPNITKGNRLKLDYTLFVTLCAECNELTVFISRKPIGKVSSIFINIFISTQNCYYFQPLAFLLYNMERNRRETCIILRRLRRWWIHKKREFENTSPFRQAVYCQFT